MKNLICFILVLALLVSVLPAAFAQETIGSGETPKLAFGETDKSTSGTCGDNVTWALDPETGVLTISGSGKMTSWNGSGNAPWLLYWGDSVRTVKISEGITSIGGFAFYGCKNLTSVSLPSTVETLGADVFCNCSALSSLKLPAKLKSVGSSCFRGCTALKALELPAALTSVGYSAFSECPVLKLTVQAGSKTFRTSGSAILTADGKTLLWLRDPAVKNATVPAGVNTVEHDAFKGDTYLQSIAIPEGVNRLAYSAFDGCSAMKTFSLPASVTAFFTSDYYSPVTKTTPFRGCPALEKVTVAAGNSCFCSEDGVLMNSAKTELLCFPEGKKGSWTVPGSMILYSGFLMNHPYLTGITFSEGIKTIPQQALEGCTGLTYVNLPSSVTSISLRAFKGCTSLQKIDLSKTQITNVPESGFEDCTALQSVKLPQTLMSIGAFAFNNCISLSDIELPDVQRIGSNAFSHCHAITELPLPASLRQLGNNVFGGTGLNEFRAPEELKEIGYGLLSGCDKLTVAVLPDCLTVLPEYTFSGCKALKTLTLPKDLVSIEDKCFYGSGIEDLLIPAGVKKLGTKGYSSYAPFGDCKNLKCLHFLGDAPEGTYICFAGGPAELTLYYPEGAAGWDITKLVGKNVLPDMTVTAKPCKYTYSATASCTENGTEAWKCSHCGKTWTRLTDASGHQLGAWLEDENNADQWKRVCAVCGETFYEAIPKVDTGLTEAAVSSNADMQTYDNAAYPVKSYLYEENGSLVRVEAMADGVDVEFCDSDYRVTRRCLLPMELPVFGGFYAGENYNYLVLGQNNKAEDYDAEVIRVIRYTKDFRRFGSVSIYGANTVYPFDAGSLRMAEAGNMLYIATCHEMFASSDGMHHQANLLAAVDTGKMELTDCLCKVTNSLYGYVSHSFNQFILVDGKNLLQLNQGDTYPRGTILQVFPAEAGSPTFGTEGTHMRYADVFPYHDGFESQGTTGTVLGGLEASDTRYLVAGSASHEAVVSRADQMNIFVAATQKNVFDGKSFGTASDGKVTGEHTTVTWLTNFASGSGVKVSAPHIVKLTGNRFCILWTEDDTLCWCYVDGNGKLQSECFRQKDVRLSDCKPITANGGIVWYYAKNSSPVFCIVREDVCTVSQQPAKPVDPTPAEPDEPEMFIDVPEGSYYYRPVYWAVKNGVTAGTGGNRFSPDTVCTRAQIVTFLWHIHGCPKPNTTVNPFTDVPDKAFYTNAVLWAVENGITAGTGKNRFSPDAACTRAQAVTFLWHYAGCPMISPHGNSFADVPADAYYYNAVNWAELSGITSGTGANRFSPDTACTRAQIVTFLYKMFSA